ncbi:hypothetical protein CCR75_003625 [Bremia lactucae]|uniref:OTU domain-containing protein n=1 Tax=Bremia lactucae TaxID=4779 RepID=A0A976IKZ7_BRELC|nr:hypothetical protein CCR75_003625 [Bremia lactucae]
MSLSWLRNHARKRNHGTVRTISRRANRQYTTMETYAPPSITYEHLTVVDYSVTFRDAKWVSVDQYQRHYHRLGWDVVSIRKDGNCLFRALSDQLYGHDRRHLELRRRLVDFIDLKRAFFTPLLKGRGVEEYCARLREAGEWGGHLELVAASRLLGIDIIVHIGPIKRLQIDSVKSLKKKEGKTINLLLKQEYFTSLRVKDRDREPQHGCTDLCLCKRVVALSRASAESRVLLSTQLPYVDGTRPNSLHSRPFDGNREHRGRLKGAYGRKPVPDAPKTSTDSKSVENELEKVLIKPKVRPLPPVPRPTTPAPTPPSLSTKVDSLIKNSAGVVLFQPELVQSVVNPVAPLIVLLESNSSPNFKRLPSKGTTANTVTLAKPTALLQTEEEPEVVFQGRKKAPQLPVRLPRRAMFNSGKRRRSSAAAISLLQEVSTSLNVKVNPESTVVVATPLSPTMKQVSLSLPVLDSVSEVEINSRLPRAVEIKKSSKKVFRQGRLVATVC